MKTIKLPAFEETGLTQFEYDSAMAGLIEKGLVEVDKEEYYLNEMGIMVAEHLDSDPKLQN